MEGEERQQKKECCQLLHRLYLNKRVTGVRGHDFDFEML